MPRRARERHARVPQHLMLLLRQTGSTASLSDGETLSNHEMITA